MNEEQLLYAALGIAGVSIAVASYAWAQAAKGRHRIREIQLAAQSLENQSAQLRDQLTREERLRKELLEAEEKRYGQLKSEFGQLLKDKDVLAEARRDSEKQAALMRQKLEAQEERIKDFDQLKRESITAAQASIMKAGTDLSTKLLEDHKRENDEARKQTKEMTEKTTEHLTKHFTTVTQTVAALDKQVSQQRQAVDTVFRALSNPADAGQYAEIGLENTLISFGLEPARDFLLQFVAEADEGSNLRPDAIVFLPDEAVLVIDCKASKFLLELAQVEGTERESEVMAQLSKTMNQHLAALSRKDYNNAVVQQLKKSGHKKPPRQTFSLMYVPNDAALAKIRAADPSLATRAQAGGITIAGPSVLSGILGFACMKINIEKQAQNQEQINEAIQQLLDGVIVMGDHMSKVNKGMQSANRALDNFARSANRTLLPRARKIVQLGIEPSRNKALPVRFESISEDGNLIDVSTSEREDEGDADKTPRIRAKESETA